MSKDFTHLHLHSQYSFLDGAIRIKDLVKKISELGMSQVAVTDHGNMFGALDFYKQAKQSGIKPILGIEAYVTSSADYTEKVRENFHLILLAQNNIGYANLKKLTSESFIRGKYFFPRIDKKLLYKHREGLIATTACLGGEVGKKLAQNDKDGARKAAREFKQIFGADNFFLEVQPNGIPIQDKVNGELFMMAKEEGLKLIATNDCHYVNKDQHDAQNMLMAIRQQKAFDDPTLHKHETDAFYIRSHDEMYDLLKTDFCDAFINACEVGKRCNVDLDLGQIYLPRFPYPNEYQDEEDYLRYLSNEGLKRRLKEISYKIDYDHYKSRLEEELAIIIKMGFSGYFLIVQDFINWAKDHEIKVGPGRGSGAGSLVAYVLRITDIDPIPYNLLFERFLNPERVSMPDFDVDFMQEGRADVINYVAQRYGRERVGQIATYSALNPKSAVKDVARTLGVAFSEINELTKPMPLLIDGKKPDLKQALSYAPLLVKKAKEDPLYKRILDNASILEGLYRQAGMHAGGVDISKTDLVDYVPVFSGQNGELITQFDKDKVEEAGLVKFDFLGLKTLDVIAHASKLINTRIAKENNYPLEKRLKLKELHPHSDKNLDIIENLIVENLYPDKKEVYELIASGDTLGIFQVESIGFQDLCRKLKPDCFEDIVAAVALYRPGPMQSGMVDDFIDRKHGKKQVVYPHPLLESVLKPTYGTIVYQEQVMQAAQVLAGYTLGAADILRRAMGKKKFEEMNKQRQTFVEGAIKNNVDAHTAGMVFDTIEKFAGYGFNKSHSAAYAMITYQTAYLKRFYPVEFMAALLTTSSNSTDDVVKYIKEAKNHSIKVLPPDINISNTGFSIEYVEESNFSYGNIRFGLGAVKGLGDAALNSILQERQERGFYESFVSFCQRLSNAKVNKKVIEALIKSGSFDTFMQTRKSLFESIETVMSSAQKRNKDLQKGQTTMFALFEQSKPVEINITSKEEYGLKDKLNFEKEFLGFFLSAHPLDPYEKELSKLNIKNISDLSNLNSLEEVSVAGVISDLKERPLKSKNGRWAVAILETNDATLEVLCFSKSYEEAEKTLKSQEPVLITGKIIIDDNDDETLISKPKLRLTSAKLLSDECLNYVKSIEILIPSTLKKQDLYELQRIMQSYPGNKPVCLSVKQELMNIFVKLDKKYFVNPSYECIEAIANFMPDLVVLKH